MDLLYKGVGFNDKISVTVISATDMVNKAIEYHKLSPLAAASLGRTLIACTFMSATLKNEQDKLSVTLNGDGVGGQIVVAGNQKLQMRGYIDNPQCDLPLKPNGKLDVAGCVGKGRMSVVKNMGLKEPYTGSCRINDGEIAKDFAAYYTYSEQQPTGMALGVKIGTNLQCIGAGGLVLQPLPDADDESITMAEQVLDKCNSISSLIEAGGIEQVKNLIPDFKFEVFKPKYECLCSKEYIDGMLITLGEKELYDTLDKQGQIEVICHFCDKKYTYNKKDIDNLLKK